MLKHRTALLLAGLLAVAILANSYWILPAIRAAKELPKAGETAAKGGITALMYGQLAPVIVLATLGPGKFGTRHLAGIAAIVSLLMSFHFGERGEYWWRAIVQRAGAEYYHIPLVYLVAASPLAYLRQQWHWRIVPKSSPTITALQLRISDLFALTALVALSVAFLRLDEYPPRSLLMYILVATLATFIAGVPAVTIVFLSKSIRQGLLFSILHVGNGYMAPFLIYQSYSRSSGSVRSVREISLFAAGGTLCAVLPLYSVLVLARRCGYELRRGRPLIPKVDAPTQSPFDDTPASSREAGISNHS